MTPPTRKESVSAAAVIAGVVLIGATALVAGLILLDALLLQHLLHG